MTRSRRCGLDREVPLSNLAALDEHSNSPRCLCLSVLVAEWKDKGAAHLPWLYHSLDHPTGSTNTTEG